MQDSVSLLIDGMQINNFLSYTIESDIYTSDDAFSLELANPEIQVKEGHRCELYVNGEQELTGIIDRVSKSHDKSGVKLKVEGRDLMGLLVDSYCEEFITLQGIKVKALAERLLKKAPFINREKIIYQENFSGKLKKKAKDESSIALMDAPHNFSQIEPGMTIFDALKDYAGSRGMMFFCLPDGTMLFGKPKEKGEPLFTLICTKDGKNNNVLEGSEVKDISKRYSKITVIGQQQGTDGIDINAINTKATIEDKDFPFYKPMVAKNNNDYQSPKLHARMLLEKSRHQGFQLNYKVPGHSQNRKNWTINELCIVKDEVLEREGTYLIYGRTFEMSKQGIYTSLKLGVPGVVQ